MCFPLLPKCGYKAFWCVLNYFTDAAFPSMLDVIIRMLFWEAKQTTPQISTPLWDNKGLPIDRSPDPNAGIPLEHGQKSYSAQPRVHFIKGSCCIFSERQPPEIWKSDSAAVWVWLEELQILSVWFALTETNQITVPFQTESLPTDVKPDVWKSLWLYFIQDFFHVSKKKTHPMNYSPWHPAHQYTNVKNCHLFFFTNES